MTEEWKDIKGYEGYYQISSLGHVRSLDRDYHQMSSHGTMMVKHYNGTLISPFDNGNGYLAVILSKSGRDRKSCYIHRLVAEAFIDNPNGLEQVNHKDYNKKNNCASNLEWLTRHDNVLHSAVNMRKPKANPKPTATGEQFITRKGKFFRLNIQRKSLRLDKLFLTLEEAVKAREVVIGD